MINRLNKRTKVLRHLTLKKPKNIQVLKKLLVAILITLVAGILYTVSYTHTRDHKNLIKLQNTVQQLEQTKNTLLQKSSTSDQQIQQLNKQLQDTQKKLEAKRNSATAYAAALSSSYLVPDDVAKAYIYSHESGNNPDSTNSIGCYGLGQDCGGVVKGQCGADYACQDAFFTRYMEARYGTWQRAYFFWINSRWW